MTVTNHAPPLPCPVLVRLQQIAFTGSTEVGRRIASQVAKSLKPCTLELGGKSPVVVCRDVDIDKAVADTHFALFFNHGEVHLLNYFVYVIK
jgi:acyl-CoA reductase-like NAD-dependent aldehyde dehydrogenase